VASPLYAWLRALGLTVPEPLAAHAQNRHRSVYRIPESNAHRACWLKVFAPQPWWFPIAHPIAWLRVPDPPLREANMHPMLARAGLLQPGVVGLHRDEASDERWVVIEDLAPMEAMDNPRATAPADMWGALAPILNSGWVLPDLAPHHVFVTPDVDAKIAVIDLHRCWRATRREAWIRTGGAWLASVGSLMSGQNPCSYVPAIEFADGISRESKRLFTRARFARMRKRLSDRF
jgi:hypothetical protein